MVGRKKKSGRKPELLGSHQRSWVWGRNLVLEILRTGRWVPHELLLADELDEQVREEARTAANDLNVPVELATSDRIGQLCQARDHPGLLAKMPRFPYATLEEIPSNANSPQLLVVLDSTQDPFNFGAICRTACVFGADGILIGQQNQVGVTSQVARSSAGAITRLKIARVEDLAETLNLLTQDGMQTVATALDGEHWLSDGDFTKPTAIVIGNEGAGLSQSVRDACGTSVRIPQAADFDSLNAAVAAGVLLYEVHRQRHS